MDDQQRVASFLAANDLATDPAHRVLDLASEVGELAKEVNESTDYGADDDVAVATDEVGDALFALLALAESLDQDASEALSASLAKYERRLDASGDPGSEH